MRCFCHRAVIGALELRESGNYWVGQSPGWRSREGLRHGASLMGFSYEIEA